MTTPLHITTYDNATAYEFIAKHINPIKRPADVELKLTAYAVADEEEFYDDDYTLGEYPVEVPETIFDLDTTGMSLAEYVLTATGAVHDGLDAEISERYPYDGTFNYVQLRAFDKRFHWDITTERIGVVFIANPHVLTLNHMYLEFNLV